jgi:hypothetical protein
MITDGVTMPGGVGYDDSYGPTIAGPEADPSQYPSAPMGSPGAPADDSPENLLPPGGVEGGTGEQPGSAVTPNDASYPTPQPAYSSQPYGTAGIPQYAAPRPYSPTRQPVYMRNASRPNNPQPTGGAVSSPGQGGLIGPVGYDPQ